MHSNDGPLKQKYYKGNALYLNYTPRIIDWIIPALMNKMIVGDCFLLFHYCKLKSFTVGPVGIFKSHTDSQLVTWLSYYNMAKFVEYASYSLDLASKLLIDFKL